MKTATSSAAETLNEHFREPQDPLVLMYNRPDLVVTNPALRKDVIVRMRKTIMDEHFDDIEMLERIVNLNDEYDLDHGITVVAPAVAARTVTGKTFADRLEEITKIADDPQNVHDPVIIKQLNETLNKATLKESFDGPQDNYGSSAGIIGMRERAALRASVNNAIDQLLVTGEISNERANAARIVATKMINSGDTCSSYNGRQENEIFQKTWSAADSADQKHNFILGLADSYTGGHSTVCMNGRLARIIGANSVQVSSADLKSSVYSYAGKIMNENGKFTEVEKYIREISDMPDSQKTILISECRAVFDENDADNSVNGPNTVEIVNGSAKSTLENPGGVSPALMEPHASNLAEVPVLNNNVASEVPVESTSKIGL